MAVQHTEASYFAHAIFLHVACDEPIILTCSVNWLVFVVERQVFRVMKEMGF